MKKIIDRRILYTNLILLGLGVIFGIIFLISTSSLDKSIIKSEITDYIEVFSNNSVTFSNFINSFKSNVMYIILICIFSCFYILSPLNLFINFYKGMQMGFLVSSAILTYKLKGILYSLLLLFPHHIIMTALIVLYSTIMIKYSLKLFKATKENKNLNIGLFIKRVAILFLGALIICLISSLLEIYLNSFLLKLIL